MMSSDFSAESHGETRPPIPELIGSCRTMQQVYRLTRKVAKSDASVLLLGETGTGKELIARAIHQLSGRKNGPFVRVNCGALTESLLESELFGHVQGSFTGAINNRTGRFEAAHTGTIFLDEINSTTPQLQVKLLRVLQEQEFERVGDTQTIQVNTRVIAASNRDLIEEIELGRFREDLYYRLNVFPLNTVALANRIDDIVPVATFLLHRHVKSVTEMPWLDNSAIDVLRNHSWPGNVRELENVLQRALVLAQDGLITATEILIDNALHASAGTPVTMASVFRPSAARA